MVLKIATQSPEEVVIIALDIPPANDCTSVPVFRRALKVCIIPTTVPKRPNKGTTLIMILTKLLLYFLIK